MNSITEKQCPKCREYRNEELFIINSSYCLYCRKKYQSEYYLKTLKEDRKSKPSWNELHKEKRSEICKKYYLNNKEKIIKNRVNRYQQKEENKKKCYEYNKKWLKLNPQKVAIYAASRRSKIRNNGGEISMQDWIDLCDKYENKCLCCGQNKKLTIDHVIPLKLGGRNDIDNIQPLCRICNSKKGVKIIDYRN